MFKRILNRKIQRCVVIYKTKHFTLFLHSRYNFRNDYYLVYENYNGQILFIKCTVDVLRHCNCNTSLQISLQSLSPSSQIWNCIGIIQSNSLRIFRLVYDKENYDDNDDKIVVKPTNIDIKQDNYDDSDKKTIVKPTNIDIIQGHLAFRDTYLIYEINDEYILFERAPMSGLLPFKIYVIDDRELLLLYQSQVILIKRSDSYFDNFIGVINQHEIRRSIKINNCADITIDKIILKEYYSKKGNGNRIYVTCKQSEYDVISILNINDNDDNLLKRLWNWILRKIDI